MGKSGRAILTAIIAGQTSPEQLADLAQGTARKKRSELVEALRVRVRDHHRQLLKVHLELVAALEQAIASIDAAVGKTLAPIRSSARLLTTLPGVSDLTAQVIVAEIGVDMARFPTAAHLISWTGLCPRSDESAGLNDLGCQVQITPQTVSFSCAGFRAVTTALQPRDSTSFASSRPKPVEQPVISQTGLLRFIIRKDSGRSGKVDGRCQVPSSMDCCSILLKSIQILSMRSRSRQSSPQWSYRSLRKYNKSYTRAHENCDINP